MAVSIFGEIPRQRPVSEIRKAIIISVDGLRPDLLLRANTPVLHAMMTKGCFTFWARTTDLAVTLPSHVSMLTGVKPEKHGITWNEDRPNTVHPKVPTLFQLAIKSGYTTAMIAGKMKFDTLKTPGALTACYLPDVKVVNDARVCQEALKIMSASHPDVMFVHFPESDVTAHSRGWGSREHMEVIERVDACIGQLLSKVKELGNEASTVVLVTADHGGAGFSHGPDDPRSLHIPWLVQGPGIQQGMDLASYRELTVHTEDTFATICFLLGIPVPSGVDGKPVEYVLEDVQLNPKKYPVPSPVKFH